MTNKNKSKINSACTKAGQRSVKRLAITISLLVFTGLISPLMPGAYSQATTAIIRTPAGSGFFGFGGDGGPATSARFSTPNGMAVDANGNLYIADLFNDRIRKVDSNGVITTFAGRFGGTFSGDGGPATEAGMFDVAGVAVDAAGNVFIADMDNNRIRKVDTAGKISTVAGNGAYGFTGDNVAGTQTALSSPAAVAVDIAGNLYIGDLFNHRIRKVNTQGIITTFAGTGVAGDNGDGGLATQAQIDIPEGLAFDRSGNLYIADSANDVVRKVDASGKISTFAGTGQTGFTGDNGQAKQARLSSPRGVVADAAGNVYIADAGNDRIRRVDPSGVITTVAGNGQSGYNADGIVATQSSLYEPAGMAADPYGVVFFADSYNDRIRMLKSAQLQMLGLSRYVMLAGSSGLPLNIIGTGFENSSTTINGQSVSATLDQSNGNLALTVPASLLAAPAVLSVQVNKTGQTFGERKIVVTTPAQINAIVPVTVSSASYRTTLAVESIGAMFGDRLATQLAISNTTPLPTSLAGTSIYANGIASPLFFVSPNQINYQIPPDLTPGVTTSIVTVASNGVISQGQLQVEAEAPGIFTANASGTGAPAAVWTLDGVNYSSVTNPDGTLKSVPAGAYFVLFGTGIRHAPDPISSDGNGVAESVQVTIGGITLTPLYAGSQSGFVGLDQINFQAPPALVGRGKVDVVIIVNGRGANTVQLQIS
ncbi:MAG: SMP-30/gluconolactonase/LRE family protein [Acidobacteriota bacterium]|nr:SMP-30/gluconolactonase/LRE family protein [Acidobacteriota bacterium]